MAPDDAARRSIERPRGALLVDDRLEAQLAGARAAAGPASPAATTRSRLNDGLCSTYSSRMRSGPQTKTANVFAASTTRSTSVAGVLCLRGEPEHGEVVERGFSGSRPAPPGRTSTKAASDLDAVVAVRVQAQLDPPFERRLGSSARERDVSRSCRRPVASTSPSRSPSATSK